MIWTMDLLELFEIDWTLRPSFFDYFALALTLLGLWIAWLQFRKARNAIQAVDETRNSLEYNQLLALLPEFVPSISEIENAIFRKNSFALQRELVRFGRLCNDAATLAGKMDDPPPTFIEDLAKCSLASGEVKERLVYDPKLDLADLMSTHHPGITRLGDTATAYATALRFRSPNPKMKRGRSAVRAQ